MKKIPISVFVGVLLILITVVLYFVFFGNLFTRTMCLVSMLGVVLAEATTTVLAFFSSKGDPRRVVATVISAGMVPIALTLSLVYSLLFPMAYGKYLAFYFACYLAIGIVVGILWLFQSKRAGQEETFQNAKGQMLKLRKLVTCIMADPAAEQYKKQLRMIEEKLHFSNDGVIVAQDAEILNLLLELQDNISNPEFDVPAHLEKLNKTVDVRTIMASRTV